MLVSLISIHGGAQLFDVYGLLGCASVPVPLSAQNIDTERTQSAQWSSSALPFQWVSQGSDTDEEQCICVLGCRHV